MKEKNVVVVTEDGEPTAAFASRKVMRSHLKEELRAMKATSEDPDDREILERLRPEDLIDGDGGGRIDTVPYYAHNAKPMMYANEKHKKGHHTGLCTGACRRGEYTHPHSVKRGRR